MRCCWLLMFLGLAFGQRTWISSDERGLTTLKRSQEAAECIVENNISPDDLEQFMSFYSSSNATTLAPTTEAEIGETTANPTTIRVPGNVDCFGLGTLTRQLPWLFNMQPQSSEKINTHFFFMSRKHPMRVQVLPGPQFGVEWVEYNATKKTVMIIHGFMSHSNASWVRNMTKAFLEYDDVNVITVDWSRGGNTWKYWRAVANTRRVGSDVAGFLRQLMKATGAQMKDFHLIGHSLGAHICSYAAYQIGGVRRITGLDPAQPCFRTTDSTERLDLSDAEFVDVIHTNGRLLKKIGFGLPDPTGHADFYPNGGMKQPGCRKNDKKGGIWSWIPSLLSIAMVVFTGKLFNIQFFKPFIEESFHIFELEQAICSHGRAYVLFTESIVNKNCTFRAHRWNLTYQGVNASLEAACDRLASCSEMGLRADGDNGALPQAHGAYFALTAEQEPYCPSDAERRHPKPHLLRDLQQGFRIDPAQKPVPKIPNPDTETTTVAPSTTTKANWLARIFG